MKDLKKYLYVGLATLAILFTFSCEIDNSEVINVEQPCVVDYDVVGSYYWDLNPNVIYTFDYGTLTIVQDGVFISTREWCKFDVDYLRLVNEYGQVSYVPYYAGILGSNVMFGDTYLIRL